MVRSVFYYPKNVFGLDVFDWTWLVADGIGTVQISGHGPYDGLFWDHRHCIRQGGIYVKNQSHEKGNQDEDAHPRDDHYGHCRLYRFFRFWRQPHFDRYVAPAHSVDDGAVDRPNFNGIDLGLVYEAEISGGITNQRGPSHHKKNIVYNDYLLPHFFTPSLFCRLGKRGGNYGLYFLNNQYPITPLIKGW